MKNTKKNVNTYSKRNSQRERSKKELLKIVEEIGVGSSGTKIKFTYENNSVLEKSGIDVIGSFPSACLFNYIWYYSHPLYPFLLFNTCISWLSYYLITALSKMKSIAFLTWRSFLKYTRPSSPIASLTLSAGIWY